MAEHASQAVIGWGTQIQYGDGAVPEAFTPVHEVITADPPDAQADEIEVTHFESPGRAKEFIAGMTDSGQMTFSVNWRPDIYPDHVAIAVDKKNGTKRNWRVVLPSAMETITARGFVQGLKRNDEPNGAITADITLRFDSVSTDIAP